MRKTVTIFVLTALGTVLTGFHAVADRIELDYAGCVAYALDHNIDVAKSRLDTEAAAANLSGAKGEWQPSLGISTTQGVTNHPWGTDNPTVYSSNYGISSSWTVYNGGERENTIRRYRAMTDRNRNRTIALERDLQPKILELYLKILYAGESVDIAREAAEVSKAQVVRGESLMELGNISKVDFAQLVSQAAQDEYTAVNARAEYSTRVIELKSLLRLTLDTWLEVVPCHWTDSVINIQPPSKHATFAAAVENDATLASYKAETEMSEYNIGIAKASGRPQISLTGGVGITYEAPGSGHFGAQIKNSLCESLGLTFTLPIFNKRKTKTDVTLAQIEKMQAVLTEYDRMEDLSQIIELLYVDLHSAQSRFNAARETVEAARLSDELINQKFEQGLVNIVELMNAHTDLADARRELVQAKYLAILAQKMIEYYSTTSIILP